MSSSSLRLEILGTSSERIGPFALLGLTPERCEAADVRMAQARLSERLARHPRRHEPEAVLLAREINAAAALLLDATTRQELIADYRRTGKTPGVPPGDVAPVEMLPPAASVHANGSGPSSRQARAFPPGFLRDLLAAWVSAGGWNGKARHRIIAAGAQHGVSGEDLLEAIMTMPVTLATPRITPLVGPPAASIASAEFAGALPMPPSLSPDPAREAHEAAKRNLFAALLAFLACAAVVLPIAAWVIIELSRPGPRPIEFPVAEAPAPRPVVEPAPSLPSVPRHSIAVPVNPMSQTYAGLLERLDRDSLLAERLDPALLGLFTQAASQGRRQWMQFDAANRERLRSVVVSVIYRLGNDPASAQSLVEAIDPDEGRSIAVESIPGRAWSLGMLAVILREPDLPPAARAAIERRWRRHVAVGQPPRAAEFDDAARFALREMIAPLVRAIALEPKAPETWLAWLQCAASLGGAPAVEPLALEAAGQVLADGPDLAASEPAGRVLAALFAAVRWRASAAGRSAMLSWWDDPRLSISDLAVVSAWLVSSGAVPGLDDSFILPVSAGSGERAELRQRLAEAWKTGADAAAGSNRTEVADWVAQAQRLLAEPIAASSEELLVQTIRAAYQQTAAVLVWSGRGEEAADLVRESDSHIAAMRLAANQPAPGPAVRSNPTADGRWAVRVFRARHLNDRTGVVELLNTLPVESPADAGPIDAAILADLALGHFWRDVRLPALNVVAESYPQGPTVLLALADRMIPDRSDGDLSQAIERITGEDLPEPRSDQWYAAARLALLRHVANLRGLLSSDAAIDALSALLSEVYRSRLSQSPAERLEPAEAARLIAEQWMDVGRPMQPIAPLPAPLEQIAHRASLRAALADDPIGRFHAWQIAGLEASCYVAAAERPAAREALAKLLDETTRDLALTRTATEQLLIAERAMLRVWILRFGAGPEGGPL